MKTMTDDEIRAQREQCADCGGALEEIVVLQNAHLNLIAPLGVYSTGAKKTKWGASHFPIEGTLLAFRCARCARVYLYGAALPEKQSAQMESDKDR